MYKHSEGKNLLTTHYNERETETYWTLIHKYCVVKHFFSTDIPVSTVYSLRSQQYKIINKIAKELTGVQHLTDNK